MKTKLSDLTFAEFIDLECGDLNVLKESHHEVVPQERLLETRVNLSNEFQSIASPASFKSMVIGREKKAKMRVKALFFGAVNTLAEMYAYDEVRALMTAYGTDCSKYDDEQLAAEVKQQLNMVSFDLKRMGVEAKPEETTSPDEIRKCYESMVADMMIINKMSIDIYTIRASVFASMVFKVNEMVKSMNAKAKKANK